MKLLNGDCLQLMKEIPDNSVDMVLCDLPYGTTSCKWDVIIPFEPLWDEYHRILKHQGSAVLFCSGVFEAMLMASNVEDYKYRWVWVKNKATNFIQSKNRPMCKSEDVLVFSKAVVNHSKLSKGNRMIYNPQGLIEKKQLKKSNKNKFGTTVRSCNWTDKERTYVSDFTNYPCDVLFFNKEVGTQYHPSQKPIPLLEYLIKTYTSEGDVVLDNCMGSGSTGVACMRTNRHFIGIELDEHYFKVAKERIQSEQTLF